MSTHSIIFTPITGSTDANGNYTETPGAGVPLFGNIIQLSETKKMIYAELINKEVYQFKCYDHPVLTNEATALWGTKNLKIYTLTKNYDGSFTNMVTIILYAK
jgi:hypothetical protein